jgi:hypothetical protein
VLVFALHFALFAVYLKSSSAALATDTSPAVKIWADPDRAFDNNIKIAPVLVLLLILVTALTCGLSEARICSPLFEGYTPARSFLRSPNWLRPPPLC